MPERLAMAESKSASREGGPTPMLAFCLVRYNSRFRPGCWEKTAKVHLFWAENSIQPKKLQKCRYFTLIHRNSAIRAQKTALLHQFPDFLPFRLKKLHYSRYSAIRNRKRPITTVWRASPQIAPGTPGLRRQTVLSADCRYPIRQGVDPP